MAIKDPVQKALRERKKEWNKITREFIDDFLSVKRMINGSPSKFHMQRSRITEPIPQDPTTILGVLAKDFAQIVNQGNKIIEEQIAYVTHFQATRKKPKQMELPLPATPEPGPQTPAIDLSKQLSLPSIASSELDELVSMGSNPFTRFFSSLKGPRFGKSAEAVKRRARLSLLLYSHKVYKLCSQFQKDIVKFKRSSDDFEGLEEANNALVDIENKLISMFKSLQSAAKNLSNINGIPLSDETEDKTKEPPTEDKTKEVPTEAPKDIVAPQSINPIYQEIENKIIPDWNRSYTMFIDTNQDLQKRMLRLIERYNLASSADNSEKIKMATANQILNIYQQILLQLNSVRGTNGDSLSRIIELSSTAGDNLISYELEAQALPSATKMHGKLMRGLFNRVTNSSRLLAYNYADEMSKELDHLMNVLEKDFDPDELMKLLNDIYFDKYFNMKESFDSILSDMMLDTSKFTPEQKKKLDKLTTSRRNREMARRLVPSFPVIPPPPKEVK